MTMKWAVGSFGSLGLTAAAGGIYWWQKNLLARTSALFKKIDEASESGQLAAAEEASLQAVACARWSWMGREHNLALALHDLARAYFLQGKLEQAEQTALQAFAAMRKLRRPSP